MKSIPSKSLIPPFMTIILFSLKFSYLQVALGDDYNLERIIDDFVLLTFLVGNDFIPHLPDFHIHAGSLPTLWHTYKEVRPDLDGAFYLFVCLLFR